MRVLVDKYTSKYADNNASSCAVHAELAEQISARFISQHVCMYIELQ